ncbi:hypothetical protein BC332_12735 [Capsicum chinense]|nr:hypothetical protein BC332_12735 [Capsicum chinense]
MESAVLSGEIAGLDLRGAAVTREGVEYKTLSLIVSWSSIDQNKPDVDNDNGTEKLSVAQKVALEVSALRLVDIPEKARKLLNLLEESKDSRGKQVFDELDDDSVVSWTSVIVGLSAASSHQGDSGLMEVPVRAFHGAFHDKTKETGEAVSPSLELHYHNNL